MDEIGCSGLHAFLSWNHPSFIWIYPWTELGPDDSHWQSWRLLVLIIYPVEITQYFPGTSFWIDLNHSSWRSWRLTSEQRFICFN